MPLKPTLTDIAVRQLLPLADRQLELWDGKVSGFGVRVSPQGTKSFVVLYRFGGVSQRLTLGRYPGLGLATARDLASKALSDVACGIDPKAIRQQQRMADKPTAFPVLLSEFVETHCKRHNKASTARETERILRNDFENVWRKREVKDLTKADVLRVLDKQVADGSPSAANHAYAAVRKFFNWCVQRGHIQASPCTGLTLPTKATKRARVLTDAELIKVWNAAAAIGYPAGPIVQLLILTAQRRGEVAGMRWCDIDLKAKTWTMPAELTKANRAHAVPLTPFAQSILMTLPKLGPLVFPARTGDGCYGGFGQVKYKFDERVGVTDWTFHDLRRTAATDMAGLGVHPHVVERVLNHASGTFGGVAGVYNRFQYLEEMRLALETWEKRLRHLLEQAGTGDQQPSNQERVAEAQPV
jgi:integrase